MVSNSEFRVSKSGLGKMDTHSKFFRLRREDIAYFKFIIESYEGMAVVRTKDPHEAIVELMVAPGWERDIEEVLEGLRKEITLEPLAPISE
jgi:hypothetical protein